MAYTLILTLVAACLVGQSFAMSLESSAGQPLRWGIMTTGKISHDFVTSLETIPNGKGTHQVVAVAARKLEKAQSFAKTHDIEKAYGSYEELVKDPQVQVVYIGAISTEHLPLAKLAMSHGKHVLCEKPMAMNVRETKELIEFAREKKVFLMEGLWSRFFPAYYQLREELKKGTVGEVKQVFGSFGFNFTGIDNIMKKELGGGTMLAIGIYCVQLASMVFGGERPMTVLAGGHLNKDGVDLSASTTLVYKNGRIATFAIHGEVELPNDAFITGSKGTMRLGSPLQAPTSLVTPQETFTYKLPSGASKKFNLPGSEGLSYEAEEVRRCINEGLLESPLATLDESLLIAETMETLRKQVGVNYPQD